MQLTTDTAQLLELAARTLEEAVMPGLEGRSRYAALMVRNALGMAARELGCREHMEQATGELVAVAESAGGSEAVSARNVVRALRAGEFDADARMHHALWAHAAVLTGITRPPALSRIEAQIAGHDTADPGPEI